MSGTKLVVRGAGASIKELWFLVAERTSRAAIAAQQRLVDITPQNAGYYGLLGAYKTNVALTGAALTDADLKQIAKASI